MPSWQHEALTVLIPLLRRQPSLADVPALRRRLTSQNRRQIEAPPRRVVSGHEVSIGNDAGFPVFTLTRPGQAATRTLLYLHGGGYVSPADPAEWRFAAALADEIGARLVFPAYPLAPASTVEDCHDELLDVFAQAAAESPDGVVVAGDSAGGGLSLSLAVALRDRGGPMPTHLVLLAPWVDVSASTPGIEQADRRDPWLSLALSRVYGGFWAGSEDPGALRDPRVSPLFADLAGLPPALLFIGTRDLLEPECRALYERAETAGWALTYVEGPGLMHVYPLLPVPEARAAFTQAAAFLRD